MRRQAEFYCGLSHWKECTLRQWRHISSLLLRLPPNGKDEKFRMTNLEWGVDFFSLTNLVKTS